MGGKYAILARDYEDVAWKIADYTDSAIKAAVTYIKARIKYQLVELSVRK